MADKFILHNDATPIITMEGTDGGPKDVIHHDVKKTLGGSSIIINASDAVGQPKWYSALNRQIDATTSLPVVNGNYSDGVAHDDNDHIMGYHFKHLGVDESGQSVTGYIDLCVTSPTTQILRIYPGESLSSRVSPNNIINVGNFLIYNSNAYNVMADIVAFCDYTP